MQVILATGPEIALRVKSLLSCADAARNADIEKVFHFDMSADSNVMRYENFLPGYAGFEKMTEFLEGQPILNFRDVTNITAMWRPFSKTMIERLDCYRRAKTSSFAYEFLAPALQESLKPNFGMVLYHEDLLRILAHYTDWSFERCNNLRRVLFVDKNFEQADFKELKYLLPEKVYHLFLDQLPHSFCKPHVLSYSLFTKISAVLKSLHKEIYFDEINRFEQKNGFRWDDIGIRLKGVSLLQS